MQQLNIKGNIVSSKTSGKSFLDILAEIDPGQVVHYVEALKNADVVVASKWRPQSSVDTPLVRRILSHGWGSADLFEKALKELREKRLEA